MKKLGFMGIAVALVGNSKALGCLLAGYLFGVLKSAYSIMQGLGIPKEVVNIIQGLIVIFISFRSGLKLIEDKRSKAKIRSIKEKSGESLKAEKEAQK